MTNTEDTMPDSPASKLAATKAARVAFEKQRAEKAAARELAEELAREELALKNAQAVACAEDEIGVGKFIALDTDLGVVIVKRCNALIFKKFQDVGKFTTHALEQLVMPCLVYPTADEFDSHLEILPATLTRCADAIATLAGVRAAENAGK